MLRSSLLKTGTDPADQSFTKHSSMQARILCPIQRVLADLVAGVPRGQPQPQLPVESLCPQGPWDSTSADSLFPASATHHKQVLTEANRSTKSTKG